MKLITLAVVLMLTATPITAQETPEASAALSAASQQEATDAAASVIRVGDNPDQIIRVRTRVRHTTVIQLPGRENILDFVVGDSEYWHLTGAANLAFLETDFSEGVNTNVALVCESGRIYSFLVSEQPGQPHLVVRIASAAGSDPRISPTGTSARLCGAGSGCSLSTDGGAGPANRRGRADPGGTADRRRCVSRPRERSIPSGPSIPRA